jgi:hypothetical protein
MVRTGKAPVKVPAAAADTVAPAVPKKMRPKYKSLYNELKALISQYQKQQEEVMELKYKLKEAEEGRDMMEEELFSLAGVNVEAEANHEAPAQPQPGFTTPVDQPIGGGAAAGNVGDDDEHDLSPRNLEDEFSDEARHAMAEAAAASVAAPEEVEVVEEKKEEEETKEDA